LAQGFCSAFKLCCEPWIPQSVLRAAQMAGISKAVFVLTMVTFAAAEVDSTAKALRGSSTNSSEVLNATSASASLENVEEAMPTSNFAVSNHGCNIKCVYADWGRGTCHGTTCVCSGLKSSHPQSLPNTCSVPDVPQGDNSCNVVCVYSDWFRGTCSGSQCMCSGGKTSHPVAVGNPGNHCR